MVFSGVKSNLLLRYSIVFDTGTLREKIQETVYQCCGKIMLSKRLVCRTSKHDMTMAKMQTKTGKIHKRTHSRRDEE